MNLSKVFDKPSDFVLLFLTAIKKYIHTTGEYQFYFGKNMFDKKDGRIMFAEPIGMLSILTETSPEVLFWQRGDIPTLHEDWNEFAQTADWLSTGCPFVLFHFLDIRDQYVHPDNWWVMINGSWERHIEQVEAYYYKLLAHNL
jgi:hypothetical protein